MIFGEGHVARLGLGLGLWWFQFCNREAKRGRLIISLFMWPGLLKLQDCGNCGGSGVPTTSPGNKKITRSAKGANPAGDLSAGLVASGSFEWKQLAQHNIKETCETTAQNAWSHVTQFPMQSSFTQVAKTEEGLYQISKLQTARPTIPREWHQIFNLVSSFLTTN